MGKPALLPDAAPADAPEDAERALWLRWREQRDEAAREELVRTYLPYARVVAASYYGKRFHDEIEFNDYFQLASVGLLESVDRFDPAFNVQFKTFAARRMHGSILNGLERMTEKQQQIAARQRLRAERLETLKAAAGEEAGAGSGRGSKRTPEQLMKFVAEVGLGLALSWLLEGTGMVDEPERAETIPFYRNAEIQELRKRIARSIDQLSPQGRTVIRYHYQQDIAFEEIARMLELSKGRIAQIHRQALLQLREALTQGAGTDITF